MFYMGPARHLSRSGAGPEKLHRHLSTENQGCAEETPASRVKNLADSPRYVLHSCYEYNYISPSIGWDRSCFVRLLGSGASEGFTSRLDALG